MPRPSILNRRLLTTITTSLAAGAYLTTAVEAAGIHHTTHYNWMREGEADTQAGKKTLKAEYFAAVKAASAAAELDAMHAVRGAWHDDWRAAMTFLERRFPDRWSRRQETMHTFRQGDDTDPVVGLHDDLARLREERQSALGDGDTVDVEAVEA